MFDMGYIIWVAIPGMIISGLASMWVKSSFNRYSQVGTRNGYTGAQAAQVLLDRAGIRDVQVVPVHGYLTDHYNPTTKELALSEPVYRSNSVAAVGVATHEAGHAIQHARNYAPLWARSILVPAYGIGSNVGLTLMGLGLFMSAEPMLLIGVVLFTGVVLFQLVTLPVEFDASARAKRLVVEAGIVSTDERRGINAVLNAAAMTYVAAAITSIMTLLYYLIRSGILGGRSND